MVANPLCCPWPCHAVGTRHQPGGERPGPCTSSRGRAKSILALNPRSPGQQRMHSKTRPCAAGLVAFDNPSSTRAGSGSDGLFMPHASPSAAPAKVILEVTSASTCRGGIDCSAPIAIFSADLLEKHRPSAASRPWGPALAFRIARYVASSGTRPSGSFPFTRAWDVAAAGTRRPQLPRRRFAI